MNLNETYGQIEDKLEEEEHATESIVARQIRRTEIQQEIRQLGAHITKLSNRLTRLPELPPVHLVAWAQAVLTFANLAFVVLDTTGVEDDADIIRVLIADRGGLISFDKLVRPQRHPTANTFYTGIELDQLEAASSLQSVWPQVRVALEGRYVLAYNLQFVRDRLDENAQYYRLPGITLIGECLQEKARSYWSTYYPPKLVGLCERIGLELPQPTTAPDRVQGQLAILRAMSQGIMDVAPAPVVEEADPLGDLEDSPF